MTFRSSWARVIRALVIASIAACSHAVRVAEPVRSVRAPRLDDRQIVTVLFAAHERAIAEASLATNRTASDDVRGYAEARMSEHTRRAREVSAISERRALAPEPNDLSRATRRAMEETVARLGQHRARDFDRAYVASQVVELRDLLRTIDDVLLPSAGDAELREELTTTRHATAADVAEAERLETLVR